MTGLREKWPWNREFLTLFVLIPALFGIVATALTYPGYGVYSLWFLTSILISLVLWLVFASLGNRVKQLQEEYRHVSGEVAEALLVIGAVQAPGLAILRDHELELVPVSGHGCTIPLSDILGCNEGHWLPGKYVWGKLVFTLETSQQKRLAFAIAESVGRRWSAQLGAK